MQTMLAGVTDVVVDWIWPLVQFLIGLNVVVFVHELGHFLAARWAGIKVERFALGMGPRLFGIKTKNTDYCICAAPVGGYVKMLGQDDFAPTTEDDAAKSGSYNAAPVRKRLVVIAAGVVMNVILAAILFVIIAMVGKDFPAPTIGGVVDGYPASRAKITWLDGVPPSDPYAPEKNADIHVGLRPGDRIVALGDKEITRFTDNITVAALAAPGEVFRAKFVRTVDGKEYTGVADLTTRRGPNDSMPLFGIAAPQSLKVATSDGLIENSWLRPGDTILSVNGQAVQRSYELAWILKTLDETVNIQVRRDDGTEETVSFDPALVLKSTVLYAADGSRIAAEPAADNRDGEETVKVMDDQGVVHEVKPGQVALRRDGTIEIVAGDTIGGGVIQSRLDVIGLIPRLTILAVHEGSPAEKAGLKPGDVIREYGQQANPTFGDLHRANRTLLEGDSSETTIVIERDGVSQTLTIAPTRKDDQAVVGILPAVERSRAVVGSIRKNSPADAAKIPANAEITAVNGTPIEGWYELIDQLAQAEGDVTLTARLGESEETFTIPALTEEQFSRADYVGTLPNEAAHFDVAMVTIQFSNPLKAIAWGVDETGNWIVSSYLQLLSMIRGQVSAKEARGPIGIGQIAVQVARKSPMDLLYMMAFISAAVAVFNFLPLPVLDGGHAVLLLIEGARRKPLPLKLVNGIQIAGLVMILGLFVLLIWHDISRIVSESW